MSPVARKLAALIGLWFGLTVYCCASEPGRAVKIQVQFDQEEGELVPIWQYFGYDEPNYSYSTNGKKLLGELAALSPVPAYIRVHNLFTTGDGSASLKWGSTNVYTEDAKGNPVYDWKILDRIFDSFHDAGLKPLVQLGFMPQAMSTHPEPYRHNFPQGNIFTGWAYPPKDFAKWGELVFQVVRHLRERYGDAEVKTWLWEVWNEPDIDYWKGTPEEFFKLYDYSADAVLRALPDARVGGPDTTGPLSAKASTFLRSFLEHCAHEKNFATGKTGSPLDFISFHPKGAVAWQDGHVQMGTAHHLSAVDAGLKIVASFPEWKQTPIVLGESDPEGCAACTARKYPQNGYRNSSLYATYTAEILYNILGMASREHMKMLGAVTWAFEFEDQPYFEGFRTLATNGIDKPVLNAFRMFGLLGRTRVKVISSGAIPAEDILREGVRGKSDINALATRNEHGMQILVWNYSDDDIASAGTPVDLSVTGLPQDLMRARLEHFRIDSMHSNSFTAWNEMGSPESPSPEQYQRLEAAGQLQLLGSPSWISVREGATHLQFVLPRQGMSLIRLEWE